MLDIKVDRDMIAQQVRNGAYYREAREWYHDIHHAPLTQRAVMGVAALFAVSALIACVTSVLWLLPLADAVPVPVPIEDMTRQSAVIEPLSRPRETPDTGLMRFLVSNYVTQRESYNIEDLAKNVRGVQAVSTPDVVERYRALMSPANPASPLVLYQRTSLRTVRILSTRIYPEKGTRRAEVAFEGAVQGARVEAPKVYVADIAFRYTPIAVDQQTGAITPMQFQVTAYKVQEKPAAP